MDSIPVNGAAYWLPENENDVISLVNRAKAEGKVICLRGSAHSFPLIGDLEQQSASDHYIYVMLARMNAVSIDKANKTVTVQAGCHLGLDPWDPTGISTKENSLLYQLDQAGLSIPDLGGIIHQTVGGFMATGSSGGSTTFGFDDVIQSVDLICCTDKGAEKRTYTRPHPDNPDDPFYGAGLANMGLMGVITSVTFNCQPRFFIAGQEATTYQDQCEIDLFGDGDGNKPSLQKYFEETQYTRLMWWPQENVKKIVCWKAWQTDEAGAKKWATQAYQKMGVEKHPELKPYQEVPWVMGSPVPATMGADLLFTSIGQWPDWLLNLLGNTPTYKGIKAAVDVAFYPLLLPKMLDVFVAVDTPNNTNKGPQQFADLWWTGLPMDNQMSDKLMPVWFTELWISIDQSKDVMNALLKFYDEGPDNTMAFSTEIYAAKKSPFWLSPSYDQDVIRIDVFWFANTNGNPADYYRKFWSLLAPFKFRPHWGKYLPDGASAQGVDYLKSLYPKWDQWMALRQELDPHQVFVNDYWRSHLGIPAT
jgi:D-arabinono-1,4-lactone oxidase